MFKIHYHIELVIIRICDEVRIISDLLLYRIKYINHAVHQNYAVQRLNVQRLTLRYESPILWEKANFAL